MKYNGGRFLCTFIYKNSKKKCKIINQAKAIPFFHGICVDLLEKRFKRKKYFFGGCQSNKIFGLILTGKFQQKIQTKKIQKKKFDKQ